jgi:hypothetical protein
MNNLRVSNGLDGSIPTAPTKPHCFELFAIEFSNKTRLSNNWPLVHQFRRAVLHCVTLRIPDDVPIDTEGDPGVRVT